METLCLYLLSVLDTTLFICETAGHAYFACVVIQEVRSYFDEHGIRSNAADALQALNYFVAAAFLSYLVLSINSLFTMSMALFITTAETVGHAYFASVVAREVRPYFISQGMQPEASDALQAFGYLVASTVILGLTFISILVRVFRMVCGFGRDEKDETTGGWFSSLLAVAAAITLIVFACLTTAHAWGWWHYFAAQGNSHLAAACQGMAAMIIAYLILSVGGIVVTPILLKRVSKPTVELGREGDSSEHSASVFSKIIIGQKPLQLPTTSRTALWSLTTRATIVNARSSRTQTAILHQSHDPFINLNNRDLITPTATMEMVWLYIFIAYYMLLAAAECVGHAYFASLVVQEVRPYFVANGMRADASDATMAFGYLVATAVILALSFISMLLKALRMACGLGPSDDEDEAGGCFSSLLGVAAAVTLVVFACLNTAHAWGWWGYFAGEGLGRLAGVCRGMAVMVICYLVLSVGGLIAMPLILWRGQQAGC
ncbi:hypothetical protein GGR52DRAFT_586270 [Hypoxylon sp. FL1284]|nr:hypothetical protein GGR52DRAFT_586270 [Hypoxylon sp. FL1284]